MSLILFIYLKMIWVGVVVITKTAYYLSILIQKRFFILFIKPICLSKTKQNKGN